MRKRSVTSNLFYFVSSGICIPNSILFTPFLFNDPKFIDINKDEEKIFFYIINKKTEAIAGFFYLSVLPDIALNPLKAPFGSFELSPGISPELISEFVDFILSYLNDRQIPALEIKHYPLIYAADKGSEITNILLNKGFKIKNADLSQYIKVTDKPFAGIIKPSKKRRLKKCIENNYNFKISDASDLKEAYAIIKHSREVKGYPTTMNYEAIDYVYKLFPDRYILFTVRDKEKIIALSLSIIVKPSILYCFYLAHDNKYNKFSPLLLVLEGVYEYCILKKINIIDLGMSTSESIINSGLYSFKKDVGAKSTLKFTFYKQL